MKRIAILAAFAGLTLAGIGAADAQSNNGPYCRQTRGSSSLDCHYTSMRQCQYDAVPSGDSCLTNPGRRNKKKRAS